MIIISFGFKWNMRIWGFRKFIILFPASLIGLYGQAFEEVEVSNPVEVSSESSDAIISAREEVDAVDDSSVAEAIERRPDLKFNNVTIDGERSNVSLSDIPAEAVSSMEVLRAITADLDADARGGALNLESRPTFELKTRVAKAEIKYETVPGADASAKRASFTYGRSHGKFGYRITANYKNEDEYSESARMDWGRDHIQSEVFQPEYQYLIPWHEYEESYSLNTRFDYKFSESLAMFLRLDYEEDHEDGRSPRLRYRFSDGEYSNANELSGTSLNAQVDRDFLGFESEDVDTLVQGGGKWEFGSLKFDFKVTYETSDYIEPDWTVIQFRLPEVDLAYRFDDPQFPTTVSEGGVDLEDPEQFQFDELLRERYQNDFTNLVGVLNVKYNFEKSNYKGFFKGGVKKRSRERTQSAGSDIYTEFDGDYMLSDVLSEYDHVSLIDSKYSYGPFPSLEKSRRYFSENEGKFDLNIRRTREASDPQSFNVKEDVSAIYAMLNIERGPYRGIIGGRMEATELDYLGNEVIIGSDGNYSETRSRTGSNSYDDFFPSVHLRRFFGDNVTAIVSWTGTIKRPDYGSVVPYRQIDYDSKSIESGNPELKPTQFNNIDVSVDYRLSDDSSVSLEGFEKKVTDIVFWEVSQIDSGEFAGFDLGRNSNGPSAKRTGVTFVWSQAMSDWAKSMSGFSFNFKATYQDTESEYLNRPGELLSATNEPDKKYQFAFVYENEKTYIQVLYKSEDDTLRSVDSEAWHDRYRVARDTVDISSSYQLNDVVRLFLNVENVFESPREEYLGQPFRGSKYELSNRVVSVGAKLKF